MAAPVLNRATARRLVLAAFAGKQVNQWASLYDAVARLAVKDSLAPSGFHLQSGSDADRGTVTEVTWELMVEGVVCPTDPSSNYVFIGLTEYGRRMVGHSEPTPHDPDGYLAALRVRVPTIDAVTLVYVEEAVASHRARNYIAATVMAGVAVENALVRLADAMLVWLRPTEAANLKKIMDGQRQAAHLFEDIRKRLDTRKGSLPAEIGAHYEVSVLGIGTVLRIARNSAGHPTGVRFDRDDSAQFLMMHPRYLEHSAKLADWMSAEPAGTG